MVKVTKEQRIKVLSEYLNLPIYTIECPNSSEYYFEYLKDGYKEGWFVYTREEREKYAREYFKDMILSDCRNFYKHLELTTGIDKQQLINMFKPEDKHENATLENVYDFLMDRGLLEKYIDIILADTSFDHYKEQLSPCCFEGGERDGLYLYQWC